MNKEQLQPLLEKYAAGTATPEEILLVENWLHATRSEPAEWNRMTGSAKSEWVATLFEDIQSRIGGTGVPVPRSVPLWRRPWLVAAALAVLLLGTFSVYRLLTGDKRLSAPGVRALAQKEPVPGRNTAVLTLGDGSHVQLGDSTRRDLGRQGEAGLRQADGGLVYQAAPGGNSSQVVYNTVATPYGGQYALTLTDGSKVWLNAGSSLTYPAAFSSKDRRVQLSGEAYFEIARDPHRPFSVTVGANEVQVLGTHFNIMAYTDEPYLAATLTEGTVRFVSPSGERVIKAGSQLNLSREGRITTATLADTAAAVSWKNGLFHFSNMPLSAIMRQVARWYNVEVIYEKPVEQQFTILDMPRSTTATGLLLLLEQTGHVHFRVEGKRVYVSGG